MLSNSQKNLLNQFDQASDRLLELGIITTDSFTGEIGEYYACQLFKLQKTKRITEAVDAISIDGKKYQVKTKIFNGSYNAAFKIVKPDLLDYVVIIYLNENYSILKVLRIESSAITDGKLSITSFTLNKFEPIDIRKVKFNKDIVQEIEKFGASYSALLNCGLLRSRHIVGDIGEYYAAKTLGLTLSESKIQKGIDATHPNGLTFEIKTRRVYSSGRRFSKARRINGLVGKTADYLVVVTLDKFFDCSGMWLIPFANIVNPESAHLEIVNYTPGTLSVIPSKVSWLNTSPLFTGFPEPKKVGRKKKLIQPSELSGPVFSKLPRQSVKDMKLDVLIKSEPMPIKNINENIMIGSIIRWLIIIFFIALIGAILEASFKYFFN
jgi:hypothetical protein